MKKTVTTLMVMSLAGNVLPAFNVLAISGLFPMYFLGRDAQSMRKDGYAPEAARRFLLAAYVYWFVSYLFTGAPLSNFASFEFLRFDGALFTAYLPLLFFTDVRLDPAFVRRAIGLFLTILSLAALLGVAEFADRTIVPLGFSVLPDGLQLIHNSSLTNNIFHGLFRSHNGAGAVYAIAALISFSLFVGSKKPAVLSWSAFWLAANFAGLVLTQSRTAYVSFLVAILLVFFRRPQTLGKTLKYGGVVLVPLLYFLLVQPAVMQRTEAVSNLEDPNILIRFIYYHRALDDFVQSPIVGTGFGRFNDQLKIHSGVPHLVYFATGGSIVNDDSHAHNSYLHFLAEGGVLGLGLMLGVWVSAFRWIGRQKMIFEEGSFGRNLAEAIQACIVLEFFMSFTEHMMGTAVSSLAILTMASLFLNLVGWKYRLAGLFDPRPVSEGGLVPWTAPSIP